MTKEDLETDHEYCSDVIAVATQLLKYSFVSGYAKPSGTEALQLATEIQRNQFLNGLQLQYSLQNTMLTHIGKHLSKLLDQHQKPVRKFRRKV